jgi:hypothetical protein
MHYGAHSWIWIKSIHYKCICFEVEKREQKVGPSTEWERLMRIREPLWYQSPSPDLGPLTLFSLQPFEQKIWFPGLKNTSPEGRIACLLFQCSDLLMKCWTVLCMCAKISRFRTLAWKISAVWLRLYAAWNFPWLQSCQIPSFSLSD